MQKPAQRPASLMTMMSHFVATAGVFTFTSMRFPPPKPPLKKKKPMPITSNQ
ncbi:hypothetical protein [Bosea sp. TAF32]|uniref:hypothetical protein n=1 Tax=Bosea sp. TAF32 TaxID=3237482 RepID=UPI003F8E6C39